MAAVLQLAWLWRTAGGMAAGFGPMNSEPLTLLLKLVTGHAQPFAHASKLPGTVKVDELIGFPCPTVLA